MKLYFTSEIHNCLDLFSSPMALNMQWQRTISNGKYEKLAVVVRVPQTMQNLAISRSSFAEGGKEMHNDL